MSKHASGHRVPRQKFEEPLTPYNMPRGIWSPQPIASVSVTGPFSAGTQIVPAKIKFFVDTGADITVIPREIANLYKLRYDTKQYYGLMGYQTQAKTEHGSDMKIGLEGYLNHLTIQLCGIEHRIPYVVVFDEQVKWSVLGRAGVIDVFRISVGCGLLTIEAK
jgi:gag-polyprotein putative aspartyl protease